MDKIKYTGEVQVRVKTKPPIKVKNAGTDAFFNLLYELLANIISPHDNTAYLKRLPTKLQLIRNAEIQSDNKYSPSKYVSLLTQELRVADNREIVKDPSNDKNSLKYTFYITNGLLSTEYSFSRNDIGKLLLLDHDSRILAYVDIELSEFATVYDDVNGQAIIEWKLMFSNS